MYTPRYNAMDQTELQPLVNAVGSAELVTVDAAGYPVATRLPVLWQGDRLVFHMAVANPHWRTIGEGTPALAIVTGPEAYITPTWYVAKATHGRVVPTWNYSAVHVTGLATVHRDPDWLLAAVTELTELHEGRRPSPWAVTDAPPTYLHQQLNGIVGVELTIRSVEGKAKRSQNRSLEDRQRIIAGLREDAGAPGSAMSAQMERDLAVE
jgi:transcriptional regulator